METARLHVRWNGLETRLEEGRSEWPPDENSKLNGPACRQYNSIAYQRGYWPC